MQHKRDPKNQWGYNVSALVKGIKSNTLVLNHREVIEVDPIALQATLQKSYNKDLTINRVSVARSGAVVVEMTKALDHSAKKKLQGEVNKAAFQGKDATR